MKTTRNDYNKYKQYLQRKHSLERKDFRLEEHLQNHPKDYISVVADLLNKSEIARIDYKIEQVRRRMEF